MDEPLFTEPAEPFTHDAFVQPVSLTHALASRQPAPPSGETRPRLQQRLAKLRRMSRFLEAYAQDGVLATGCKAAGVDRKRIWNWQQEDHVFSALMKDAYEQARDRVEAEVVRRAVEGYDRPVYQGGKRVGVVREYSDTLLALLVKQRRPSFAATDKSPVGQTTNHVQVHQLVVPIERLTDEQFKLLEEIYGKAGPPLMDVPKALKGDSGE